MPAVNALRTSVIRAAAILTTAEVAGTTCDLWNALDNAVDIDVDFTLGSLTNVTLRFYVSVDNANWRELVTPAGGSTALILTASQAVSLPIKHQGRYLRVTAQGAGTVAGSSLALAARFRHYSDF